MYLTKKKTQDAFVKFTWTDFTTILKLVKMLRKLHLSVNPSFNFSTLLFFFKTDHLGAQRAKNAPRVSSNQY